jgi:hydrogenase nickel incorporation protein HypB
MCGTCGCGNQDNPERAENNALSPVALGVGAAQRLAPDDRQAPLPTAQDSAEFETSLYARNRRRARDLRLRLSAQRILLLNLVSSPGTGKTTLLVETLGRLPPHSKAYVIEGDQQTELDAERIRATGTAAVQINTGQACHLEAERVDQALLQLQPESGALVFVENVGNLICPAHFDLGEGQRVVLLSVTEGDDKPLKYPDIFASADLVLITKSDLLPYVDFNLAHCRANIEKINPNLDVITSACGRSTDLSSWLQWLSDRAQEFQQENRRHDFPA